MYILYYYLLHIYIYIRQNERPFTRIKLMYLCGKRRKKMKVYARNTITRSISRRRIFLLNTHTHVPFTHKIIFHPREDDLILNRWLVTSFCHRYYIVISICFLFYFYFTFYIYIVIIKNYNIQERILLNTITTINERIAYIHSY